MKLETQGRIGRALVAFSLLGSVATATFAADEDWRLRVGPGRIAFHEQITLSIGGAPVPGAGAKLSDDTTLLAEIGYRFTPEWSAGLTVDIPPTTDIDGTGSAAAFGRLGEMKYGPLALTGQYQFNAGGRLQPYLGAGAVYYLVMDEKDGAVAGLTVDNAWGSVLQAGVDYKLSPTLGLFVDVKKLFLKTTASGNLPALGGAPVKADAKLDPLVIQAGLLLQF